MNDYLAMADPAYGQPQEMPGLNLDPARLVQAAQKLMQQPQLAAQDPQWAQKMAMKADPAQGMAALSQLGLTPEQEKMLQEQITGGDAQRPQQAPLVQHPNRVGQMQQMQLQPQQQMPQSLAQLIGGR